MMIPKFPTMGVFDTYVYDSYLNFLEGSLRVMAETTDISWQAWNEFFTSPQQLVKRNLAYFQEVMTPPEPAWQTPYQEVALPERFGKIVKLLDFAHPHDATEASIPTLLLPPQAGHHSYIADYSPEQSQTQTLRRAGLDRIYCVEWLSATRETAHTTIEDYIQAVNYIINLVGGKANLVGDCQGGWLAAIYAALYPETVNALVVAGAPIDFQAGNGAIKKAVNYNARVFSDRGMSFYRSLVRAGGGVLDGRWLLLGFNMMRPSQYPERYLNLYRDINKPQAHKRFQEMKNWYDYPQDLAGDFYLWLVEHLFRDNELIKGQLVVQGRQVDLQAITCPVYLLGGTRDHITPPDQVFAIADYVGTPENQIEKYLVEAGHIGLFMGREVLNTVWTEIGQRIAALSDLPDQIAA